MRDDSQPLLGIKPPTRKRSTIFSRCPSPSFSVCPRWMGLETGDVCLSADITGAIVRA